MEIHPPLYVVTGFPDDPRLPLDPSHALFLFAAHARRYQDAWTPAEHQSFWRALLPRWPRPRGPRPTRDRLAEVASYLRCTAMLTPAEIGDVLGMEGDSVRRKHLVAWGDTLFEESPYELELGSKRAEQVERAPPAPIVYGLGEDPPVFSRVNLPPEVELTASPIVARAWERAERRRREMWASGALRYAGKSIVRVRSR